MCGIVGYTGRRNALPVLLDALQRLEYRGYDSAGVGVGRGQEMFVVRAAGRLSCLKRRLDEAGITLGEWGIGHTRWATHGAPVERNAHPQCSADGLVTLVHNGIVENAPELRRELASCGYIFRSETDTEAAALLLHRQYQSSRDPLAAIAALLRRAVGAFAIAVMFSDRPREIYGVRRGSPLIAAEGEDGCFLASDIPALLGYTRRVFYLQENGMVRLSLDGVQFFDEEGRRAHCTPVLVDWDAEGAERGAYAHFMQKEIFEQPRVVRDTLAQLGREGIPLSPQEMAALREIFIVGCGSAYHVGLSLRDVMEELIRIPVRAEIASEFRYRRPLVSGHTLVVIISQSGETADSLAALRLARSLGALTLSIVNVRGSSIARESDRVIYTQAGAEIAVATTKAYSAQLAAGYALSLQLAAARGLLPCEEHRALEAALAALPKAIEGALQTEAAVMRLARRISGQQAVFFVGRCPDYAACMEASLKLKEVSYLHAEAYAAGELKHGTLSLISEGTPVVGVMTQPQLLKKTLANLEEVKSRGAYVAVVTNADDEAIAATADEVICIPKTHPLFATGICAIPLQLLAYHTGVLRGTDVDRPRNLAKSVTVE